MPRVASFSSLEDKAHMRTHCFGRNKTNPCVDEHASVSMNVKIPRTIRKIPGIHTEFSMVFSSNTVHRHTCLNEPRAKRVRCRQSPAIRALPINCHPIGWRGGGPSVRPWKLPKNLSTEDLCIYCENGYLKRVTASSSSVSNFPGPDEQFGLADVCLEAILGC